MLGVLCGHLGFERGVMFDHSISEPLGIITAILPGPTWLVLLLRIVLQDAMIWFLWMT